MTVLRLGISPCPNDVYIFSGIILNRIPTGDLQFEIEYQDVENMNLRAQQADLDVIKISYANYPRCEARYELLECGGALGRGVGPLLLTNGAEFCPENEILVPGEFTTANFLLDFYAKRPLQKRYKVFDALYEDLCRVPGAQGVVIHEKRFTFAKDGLTLVQDLGEYWERETGHAIPLGAIVLRRELPVKEEIEAVIRRSLAWADAHYEEAFALCRRYAQDLNEEVIKSHIGLYVNEFSRNLGDEGRAAVSFFLEQQKLRQALRTGGQNSGTGV